ncbi:MAG TPA: hypothetical protein PK308_10455, partial [Phycisphaerales bacterium]|nr:hypothetical protein [Phycisphaerales bacterium]
GGGGGGRSGARSPASHSNPQSLASPGNFSAETLPQFSTDEIRAALLRAGLTPYEAVAVWSPLFGPTLPELPKPAPGLIQPSIAVIGPLPPLLNPGPAPAEQPSNATQTADVPTDP